MRTITVPLFILSLSVSAHALADNIPAGKNKSILCAGCHSTGGKPGISANDQFPNLAAQKKGYIVKQLKAFKSGERKDAVMQGMAASLSEQDMKNIAAYFSSLK